MTPRAPRQSSAVSNGSRLFVADDLDARSAEARRFRDILSAVASDIGGAGELSEVQRQLARRFASLALSLELQEAALVSGEAVDLDLFGRLSGQLNRLANTLGLRRVAKDVTPDLRGYIDGKATS
jgi:hypothetical protein